jgi:hypothetical protein
MLRELLRKCLAASDSQNFSYPQELTIVRVRDGNFWLPEILFLRQPCGLYASEMQEKLFQVQVNYMCLSWV